MKKTRREIKKQEKIRLQNYGNGLRIYTGLRVQQSWQEVTDEIRERLDFEFEWFGRNGLAKGMLMLKGFMDAAKEKLGIPTLPTEGFLAGSAVAYCLGMTGQDPIAARLKSGEFSADFENRYLNVCLYSDLDTRNAMIELADSMFEEKCKLRLGVPVIRMDRIYLEFRRDMTPTNKTMR